MIIGCANGLFCESLLQSGTPSQQSRLTSPSSNLVCRQLLFSAANGSMHGPAMEEKTHRLIVMCEQFFKYQQGYVSKAFTTLVLENLTNLMDSAAYQKFVAGGGGTFLHNGSRAFWREGESLWNCSFGLDNRSLFVILYSFPLCFNSSATSTTCSNLCIKRCVGRSHHSGVTPNDLQFTLQTGWITTS